MRSEGHGKGEEGPVSGHCFNGSIFIFAQVFHNRCMEHTMHLAACHFVCTLGILAIFNARQCAQQGGEDKDDEDDEEFDVDTSMEVGASEDDPDAICELSITDFDAGNVVGKLMAFVSQLQLCGEDMCDYLKHLALSNGTPDWEIKLWVHTRWGSLSDCFKMVLAIRKVHNSCSLCFMF